jgi:hypothetical protein
MPGLGGGVVFEGVGLTPPGVASGSVDEGESEEDGLAGPPDEVEEDGSGVVTWEGVESGVSGEPQARVAMQLERSSGTLPIRIRMSALLPPQDPACQS